MIQPIVALKMLGALDDMAKVWRNHRAGSDDALSVKVNVLGKIAELRAMIAALATETLAPKAPN